MDISVTAVVCVCVCVCSEVMDISDTAVVCVCVCVQGDGGGGESCVSETGMLRQFAFVTCLLRVLSRGLQSFKLARYRQLNKRIGRLIRSVRLGHHSALWLRHLLYYYFPSTAVAVEITSTKLELQQLPDLHPLYTGGSLGARRFMYLLDVQTDNSYTR